MPDWLVVGIVIYTVVLAVIVIFAGVDFVGNPSYFRKQFAARVILGSPLWPLIALFYIAYGIYRLIQIAVAGE